MTSSHRPQIFLLHFAGGNQHSFRFLKSFFELDFEFIPLELPGRGMRAAEPLLTNREEAVKDYLGQIVKRRNDKPFVIYGHSMGASLALQVVVELEKMNEFPFVLAVSGKAWPITGVNHKRYLMSPDQFKTGILQLGGIPDMVQSNPRLFNFYIKPLRSDFEIIEKKGIAELDSIKISGQIIVLMGDEEDAMIEIDNWQKFTDKKITAKVLSGNHFFIKNHPQEMAILVKKGLNN